MLLTRWEFRRIMWAVEIGMLSICLEGRFLWRYGMDVNSMMLAGFWVAGLLAIGLVGFLFAKSISVVTTQDTDRIGSITVWACVMATIWIVFGGAVVLDYLAGK